MSQTRYIAYFYHSDSPHTEIEFDCLQDAERFMESEGFIPTYEQSSDAETEGGHILWEGYCDFWTEEGRMLDSYPEGYEPRIRILHRAGKEASDDED